MKIFQTFEFDLTTYERELNDFNQLLENNINLEERTHILPFFRQRLHLSSRIAALFSEFENIDKIAFEYDLRGDFCCDLVIGDSLSKNFCFVEFEDANVNSLFSNNGRFKPKFSYRFEQGYSQVVDWFFQLKEQAGINQIYERFSANSIDFEGILVIGRNQYLDESQRNRINWRSKRIMVDSKRIRIITYDDLFLTLDSRLKSRIFL